MKYWKIAIFTRPFAHGHIMNDIRLVIYILNTTQIRTSSAYYFAFWYGCGFSVFLCVCVFLLYAFMQFQSILKQTTYQLRIHFSTLHSFYRYLFNLAIFYKSPHVLYANSNHFYRVENCKRIEYKLFINC